MPIIGNVDVVTRTFVAGWALDTDAPDRPVALDILVVGARRMAVEAKNYREDLKLNLSRLCPAATGNHAFRHDFEPPIHLFDTRTITVSVAGTGQALTNGTRTLHAIGTFPNGEQPLLPAMVMSTGRSGTTLMMKRLAAHPEIVATPHFPFETKQLAYYAAAFRTLVSSADLQNSTHPDKMNGNRYFVGYNPFFGPAAYNNVKNPGAFETYFEGTMPRRLGDAFRDIIRGYYDIIRTDQNRPAARFFCEKVDLDPVIRHSARYLFGQVREIALLRDPRDILCSAKSFWKWRQDENEALQSLRNAMNAMRLIRDEGRDDVLLVRYEDLVQQEAATLARIRSFMGLTVPFEDLHEGDAAMFQSHATSESPAASLGRWRHDLSAETIALCNETFGPFLSEFGYAI